MRNCAVAYGRAETAPQSQRGTVSVLRARPEIEVGTPSGRALKMRPLASAPKQFGKPSHEELEMSATIIDGKAYADSLAGRIASSVPLFAAQTGRKPGLAVVLVGADPASEIYVRSKGRKTVELGMRSFERILPATISQAELLSVVAELNADD